MGVALKGAVLKGAWPAEAPKSVLAGTAPGQGRLCVPLRAAGTVP